MKSEPIPASNSMASTDGLISSIVSEDDRLRSQYMRHLIYENSFNPQSASSVLPRVLVQFWNDTNAIPSDVCECIDSWQPLDEHGFERLLFDDEGAARFIADHFDRRYLDAFERCRHPAMRSDYFRLCFIMKKGGFYVDADDVYQGGDFGPWFRDNRLKLQPLSYDSLADSMVDTADFMTNPRNLPELIFYVNNNPIIAPSRHPVIRIALERATRILLAQTTGDTQDVQSTTGPGNLTASLVRHAIESEHEGETRDFALLADWDTVSVSRWSLDYRRDKRNWRLWDGRDA
jgi:hypothetical protein